MNHLDFGVNPTIPSMRSRCDLDPVSKLGGDLGVGIKIQYKDTKKNEKCKLFYQVLATQFDYGRKCKGEVAKW